MPSIFLNSDHDSSLNPNQSSKPLSHMSSDPPSPLVLLSRCSNFSPFHSISTLLFFFFVFFLFFLILTATSASPSHPLANLAPPSLLPSHSRRLSHFRRRSCECFCRRLEGPPFPAARAAGVLGAAGRGSGAAERGWR